MADDLKIIVSTELEADEQASARRISAQLPNIARLINSKGNIKVGVILDESNLNAQGQKITRQVQQSVAKSNVKMDVDIGAGKIAEMVRRLEELKVPDSAIASFKNSISEANIKVTDITTSFDAMSKTVIAAVTGVNKFGDTVRQTQSVKLVADENGEVIAELNKDVVVYQQNIEKVAQAQAKRAAQEAKENELRVLYLTQQRNLVDELHSKFTDPNASKPIVYLQDLEQINNKYGEIIEKITALGNTQGRVSAQERTDLESQIASYKILAAEIRNAEYVATNLRARTTEDVNAEQRQKLSEYENKLKSSGRLTEAFQNRIAELRSQLETAFDSKSLTNYLNQFDRLKSEVGSFNSQVSAINAGFKKLAEAKSSVFATKGKMLTAAPDSAEYKALEKLLANQLRYQREISAEIGKQVAKNPVLIKYASEYQNYLYLSANAAAELAIQEGRVKDAVKSIDASMQPLPAVVQNIEARFNNLRNAPDELTQKVRSLHDLMKAVSNANSDAKKIAAYEKLKESINGCNKEITQLIGVQNSELRLFRNTEGIEKAKADLAAIGRQWSALKRDPGLNTQFQQLGENLKLVERGEMELRAWTAQFGRFKAEVKAAGKNMMSLADTFKNNLGKVTQWVSATTVLFAAFRKIREAVSIVVRLNTAMIDLRKTTNATEVAYRQFYLSANETAKKLGATTEAVISQTAEWSRLGYSMREAAKMAENSAIFAAISPELDTQEATDGLISIMKAFEYDADEVLDGVISKINKLGNELAISNKDIVEVMTRSSSAMRAANTSFEETAALAVAAVEVTRDAAQAGNALRTMSMRVRAIDEETEEYSEDLAILTGKIADLTKTASNGFRGVSLFETGNPEQYRSIFEIYKDIADIYNELTDKNQAQLLEVLFGKQRAQVGAAILSNFKSAESAMEKMANSAGSAMQEMDKVYASLEYKLNKLRETWVSVAQNLVQTEHFKFVVNILTALSEAVDGATSALGLFGTVSVAVLIRQVAKSVGEVKIRELTSAPTYTLVETRNELAA